MKALDIVRTPLGAVAIVLETHSEGREATIDYFGPNETLERNAWWSSEELEVIDSLPRILALATAHPFGSGKDDVNAFYPEPNEI